MKSAMDNVAFGHIKLDPREVEVTSVHGENVFSIWEGDFYRCCS